jgi:phospholipid-translocating ATPase
MVLAKCSICGLEYQQPFERTFLGELVQRDSRIYGINLRFMLVLSLCNDVLPRTDDQNSTYEGASPDELALVKAAAASNVVLKEKRQKIWVLDELGTEKEYEVLVFFPFSPEKKRVSVLVKYNGTILLMVKGADQVVLPMCTSESLLEKAHEDIASFAMQVTNLPTTQFEKILYLASPLIQN